MWSFPCMRRLTAHALCGCGMWTTRLYCKISKLATSSLEVIAPLLSLIKLKFNSSDRYFSSFMLQTFSLNTFICAEVWKEALTQQSLSIQLWHQLSCIKFFLKLWLPPSLWTLRMDLSPSVWTLSTAAVVLPQLWLAPLPVLNCVSLYSHISIWL